MNAAPPPSVRVNARVTGLVADDVRAYAASRNAEVVAFHAPRGGKVSVQSWLEAVAAIEGRTRSEARALAKTTIERAGLIGAPLIGGLHVYHRIALALAEAAVSFGNQPSMVVVVPEPPVAWPARTDVRRQAASLLEGVELVLHAREAWELTPLMPIESIVDGAGERLAPASGARSIIARVYGEQEQYDAWRAALDALSVTVRGGPIAHVLQAPEGVTPAKILAAAYEAGLDVLEVRDAFDAPPSP